MAKSAPTMSAVARQAGVSRPTVSHVLNGRGANARISAATQERIWAAVHDLNYRPNHAARSVRAGRFGCAALVLSSEAESRSYLPGQLLVGIDAGLAAADMHLVVTHLPDAQLTNKEFVPRILRQWMADGLLINYNERVPPGLMELVERFHLPAIWLNNRLKIDSIYPDDHAAAFDLTRQLFALGARHIVYLDINRPAAGLQVAHYSVRDRLAGYEAAMREAGREPTSLMPNARQWGDRFRWAIAEIERSRADAIIAYSMESLAPAIQQHLQSKLHVRAPRLATFANDPITFGQIELLIKIVPNAPMGRGAVELLRQKIETPTEPIASVAVNY